MEFVCKQIDDIGKGVLRIRLESVHGDGDDWINLESNVIWKNFEVGERYTIAVDKVTT